MAVAPVPAPLRMPTVVAVAKVALSTTLKQAGKGTWSVSACHKTAPRYGICNFTMDFKSNTSGRKFRCHGTILVRDIGNGPEKSYGTVYCNGKKVG